MRFISLFAFTLFSIVLPVSASEAPVSALDKLQVAGLELVLPPGAELVESETAEQAARHMVVLGSLERVNQQLVPEGSEFVFGTKSTWTWHLPQSRRTRDVSRDFEAQLADLQQVFHCRGRGCGPSNYWANQIFERAILYGPVQHQYYRAFRLNDTDSYLLVYVGQRATRKIYLHIEYVEG